MQSDDSQPDEKPNILLVDDRPENLFVMEEVLRSPRYNLIRAQSGAEALKQVLSNELAVILLDVRMPIMNGFETAELIRQRDRSRDVPILFVTAINKEEPYVHRGYDLGAADYIFKPFDPQVLRAKVAFFVDLFEKNRQIARQSEILRQSEQKEKQRQFAELRQQNEARYRNLADAIPQIVWITSASGHVDYVNRRGMDYLGGMEGPPGSLMYDLLHPDDYGYASAQWAEAMRTGEGFSLEARLQNRANKNYRWHLMQLQPEKDTDGRLVEWLGTATDIDDQKRIEQALAEEKERLGVTLRSIADGVITTDTHDNVILLNWMAEHLTGWKQDEAAGKPLSQIFRTNQDRRQSTARTDKGVRRLGDSGDDEDSLLVARNGGTRLISHAIAPIRTAQSQVLGRVLVFRDITDKQRLEEERQKASKLESIGLLAGSIAHDFNNMLMAIMGNITLARLDAEEHTELHARLGDAENAIIWAKDLTQQLLTFAKGGAPVRKRCDRIAELVRESAEFASRGAHLRCTFKFGDGLWSVDIDEGQIRQVIQNLVINAQQAQTAEGEITIEVSNVSLMNERLSLPPGRYVRISCEDQGRGIAPEHLPKIFDPYFTTKQKGSGLGLATAYSIVKKHDGVITVESELSRGSQFRIYLPATHSTPHSKPAPTFPSAPAHGRILIMDDEPRVRDTLGRMLRHFGYEVGFAQDGAEAIAQYQAAKARGEPFDVVIMDLVVPGGMGGKETIGKLHQIDPSARAIVSSGYSNDTIMADFRSFGFCQAIAKPYRHEDLRSVLHQVISGDADIVSAKKTQGFHN